MTESFREIGLNTLNEYIPSNVSKKIENAIYKYSTEYTRIKKRPTEEINQIYMTKINDLYFNIKSDDNPDLLINIIDNNIDIEKIPYMTASELNSKQWESIIKRREYIENKKNYCEESVYSCKRCKEKKCHVYQLQTRSADEPMTTFVQCLNCGHTMKF